MGFSAGFQGAVDPGYSRNEAQHLLDIKSSFSSLLKHTCFGCVNLGMSLNPFGPSDGQLLNYCGITTLVCVLSTSLAGRLGGVPMSWATSDTLG
jgi:hypothetical protein